MKPFLFSVFNIFLLMSCSSKQAAVEKKCPKLYKTDFTEVVSGKYETIFNQDTITFNEIRFQCVYSAFYTHKVMFDKFGKWDKAIYPSNSGSPILLWEKVDLLSTGKKYNIYTGGEENRSEIYSSVMIFDEKDQDVFAEDSEEKRELAEYFSDLMRNKDLDNKDFHEIYWNDRNAHNQQENSDS